MKRIITALFVLSSFGIFGSGCAQANDNSNTETAGAGGGTGPGGSTGSGGSPSGGSLGASTGGSAHATGGAQTGGAQTGGAGTGGSGAAGHDSGTSTGGTPNGGAGAWTLADLPAASATVVYLSDLTEKGAVAFDNFGGAARPGKVIGKDVSLAGNPLVINGVRYAKGIECRAFTQVWYTLGKQYKRFVAETGLDYLENSTRTGFEVKLDGALVYDTGNVDKSDVKHIDIDVTGVSEMEVFTRTDAFDSVDNDFGIWGGARLLK